MLMSTPTKLYVHRNTTCDSSMSPKYHRHHCTPPRSTAQNYDSPMLTPSPLRQRPLFPINMNTTMHDNSNDDILQSPYKSPALAQSFNPFYATKPQAIPVDDEEGHIFLSSAGSSSGCFTPFFTPSSSQPLLTPVKQTHRPPSRPVLSAQPTHTLFGPAALPQEVNPAIRVGVGTKRKSTPHATPLRPHNLTPLKLTQSKDSDASVALDRLAPLAAPKFTARTPQSKAETDAYLKRQTATLIRLRLSDQEALDFDAANDSGCEMDEDDTGNALFLNKPTLRRKNAQQFQSLQAATKGKEKEEVAEAISPGGHITKRRARSRPVSAELQQTLLSPNNSPIKLSKPSAIPCRVGGARPRHSGAIVFPATAHRGRASPASSSSDAGSPRPRRRISGGSAFVRPHAGHHPQVLPPRPPLERIESATLFFGPSIPAAPKTVGPMSRSRINTDLSAATPAPIPRQLSSHSILAHRHSYAGPEKSANDLTAWKTFQTRNVSPSPGFSPFAQDARNQSTDMEDEDMFFAGDDSSFVLNVTRNTPSPPAKTALPMKYKPRDSVVVSDEDEMPSTGSSTGGEFLLSAMPKASTSVTSICSDDGLVTPGVAPDGSSGWPATSVFVNGDDTHPYGGEGVDVDEFIMKTLAAASKGSQMPKKIPGTPVKKVRMSYFGNERPWQSAVASKVGPRDDRNVKKAPRKSMPAAFPPMGAKASKLYDYQPTDTEDEEEYSPIARRDKYTGLGLGQPTQTSGKNGVSAIIRNRWPVRRGSSGAFSSGSESASLANTPTRGVKGIDWHLPKPRIPLRLSPSSDALDKAAPRSASGSSSNSVTLNSPTTRKGPLVSAEAATGANVVRHHPRTTLVVRRPSYEFTEEQQSGRFERDFDEIEEVGSGEFGKVIKVRSKNGDDGQVYAIKKSKRFEGAKHRLRLREEVDILKHLSQAALAHRWSDGRHPNVLGYIDSWEEDEALYIRTELCESGNLARFLWEYGRVFPRLDEARVWKIVVDLSNGLRFIHDSGVIHLDLKPSNVFVTKEGRFKIGDFGMASLWPRPRIANPDNCTASGSECRGGGSGGTGGGFEREGDKLYLAPEVLQGRHGKAADIFSFGMTILETAYNIVVPDQGEAWHRLRNEDFSQVDLEHSSDELVDLVRQMMRTDPAKRLTIAEVCERPVVSRARAKMEKTREELSAQGKSVWGASPLAGVPEGFLEEILGKEEMDTSA